MNIYMKALGFHKMDSSQESKFIQAGIKSSIENNLVLRHEGYQRGVIILRVSKMTGLYVYGRFEDNQFIYEYHFPFIIGNRMTENEELTVERHLDKESYAVVCDEMKTGVTLIFYLQNVMDYLEYIGERTSKIKKVFDIESRNEASKLPIKGTKVCLTALSTDGTILLPINKTEGDQQREREAELNRQNLIAAAKNGDENAIENLTIDDIDTYTVLSHRIIYEDVLTIVDSTFMPCGVECDQYSVIGTILELSEEQNMYTQEKIYIMTLDCNDLIFTMAISSADLTGEPMVGRRFKGQIWLHGAVKFTRE